MFSRAYMEHHAARFKDLSFLFWQKNSLVGVLPLCVQSEARVVSHSGLSFGEIIWKGGLGLLQKGAFWRLLLTFLAERGYSEMYLKPLSNYQKSTFDDSNSFFLACLEAKIVLQEASLVIDEQAHLQLHKRKQRNLKKAIRSSLMWQFEDNYTAFWALLTQNLQSKHKIQPTHSLAEIQFLANTLPANIRLACAYNDGTLAAGIVVFLNQKTVHCQYIAASLEGKKNAVLDWLVQELRAFYKSFRYFSFGVSSLRAQQAVNSNLHKWKEEFGAQTALHSHLLLDIHASYRLDSIWR